jgi:Zn-dependent peptidase ImmA (M78 family)
VTSNVLTEEAMVAAALRAELEIAPKADLDQLATQLGLTIVEVDSQSFEGALLRSSRDLSGRILVRRGIRESGRRRFTIAHEIGHYILHGDHQIPCSPRVIEGWKEGQPKPEREADTFASELLLPTNETVQYLNKRWPAIEVVVDVADHFGASLMAAGRKFCDVASQACAVVWSSQRQIRWFHGSPAFAHFIEVGKEIDFDSIAFRAYEGKPLPGEMEEVPAEAWIKSSWLKEDAVISEQTVPMPSYNGCLSLIWVRRPIEDRPTVEDELLRELSPDDFTIRRNRWPR